MFFAVAIWRQHPTEIECDFANRGLDIADWHAGRMSSRKLLVLLRHAPESGPYKTALRDGNWPEWAKILAETHRELALYRAGKYAGGKHEYTPKVFLDPVERVERFNETREQEEFESEARDDFFSSLFD